MWTFRARLVWTLLVLAILVLVPSVVFGQPVPLGEPGIPSQPVTPWEWYGSKAGIVGATIALVNVFKRVLSHRAWFGAVPTWLYSVGISTVLTLLTNLVFKTLPGNPLQLVSEIGFMSAAASGFQSWITAGNTTLQQTAINAGILTKTGHQRS